MFYRTNGNDAYIKYGTVSGTSTSWSTGVLVTTTVTSSDLVGFAMDSANNKLAITYVDSDVGKYAVYNPAYTATNLTSENYIGMSGGVVTDDSRAQEVGSATVFESGTIQDQAATFDTFSNKVVVAYRDESNSERGTAVVGTVSGTSISFGTPVVFETGGTESVAITFDSNSNKVVIIYQDVGNSRKGTAIVGTVSGTSISFGSHTTFTAGQMSETGAVFDSNSNKVVVAYRDTDDSQLGKAIVGTVSGTSISFGSSVVLAGASSASFSPVFDSNSNKVVIAYRNDSTNYGEVRVGTVSGTSISFGTAVVFNSSYTIPSLGAFDSSNNKVVFPFYRSAGDTVIVGTVSGTSISFGTPSTFSTPTASRATSLFDSNTNKVFLAYQDGSNSNYGTLTQINISGTDISFGTPVVFAAETIQKPYAVYDSSSDRVAIAYRASTGSGTGVAVQTPYTNIIRAEVADGDNAVVDIVGTVSTNQLSLTAGQQYFVQTDGTLSETPADPSVLAGTAISATKLIVKT